MSPLTITCETCARHWAVATPYTVHEQQAVESCPCPDCGAYTLSCPDPDEREQAKPQRRRWRRAVAR